MGLSKNTPTPHGIVARYHRIVGHETSYIREPEVEGSQGSAFVRVASYASKEARDNGAAPLSQTTLRVRFGKNVTNHIKNVPILVVRTDEPTRADLYEAVARSVDFFGAEEA